MTHRPIHVHPHHVVRGIELAEAITAVLLLAAILIAGLSIAAYLIG